MLFVLISMHRVVVRRFFRDTQLRCSDICEVQANVARTNMDQLEFMTFVSCFLCFQTMCWKRIFEFVRIAKTTCVYHCNVYFARTNAAESVNSSHVSAALEKSCLRLCLLWLAFVMPAP